MAGEEDTVGPRSMQAVPGSDTSAEPRKMPREREDEGGECPGRGTGM